MPFLCPGSDQKGLRMGIYKCPRCGAEVQIFSDETGVKCHECGKIIDRSKVPSCIEWCVLAQQCLGEGKYKVNSYPKKGG